MQQEKTISYYQQTVKQVLEYIAGNLSGDLSIQALSEYSGISLFHFHRIMKSALDEPLAGYIDRTRLEKALGLIRNTRLPLFEIAENIGYQNLSSFTKAFGKEFGISPLDYRNNCEIVLNTHVDYTIQSNRLVSDIKPKFVTIPDRDVVFIPVTGAYGGTEVIEAWDELGDFVLKNRLLGWRSDVFSIYYDDPDVTEPHLCRSDICVAVRKKIAPSGRISLKKISGGKYVVFRYRGPYEFLYDLYNHIYREWVLKSNVRLGNSPSFEKYLNFSHQTKPENLLTEIYIPVEL